MTPSCSVKSLVVLCPRPTAFRYNDCSTCVLMRLHTKSKPAQESSSHFNIVKHSSKKKKKVQITIDSEVSTRKRTKRHETSPNSASSGTVRSCARETLQGASTHTPTTPWRSLRAITSTRSSACQRLQLVRGPVMRGMSDTESVRHVAT